MPERRPSQKSPRIQSQACQNNSTGSVGLSEESSSVQTSENSSSNVTLSTEDGQDNREIMMNIRRETIQSESCTDTTTSSSGNSSSENSCCSQGNLLKLLCRIPCSVIDSIICFPYTLTRAYCYAKARITKENICGYLAIPIIIFVGIYCGCQCWRLDCMIPKDKYEEELKSLWQSQVLLEEQLSDLHFIRKEAEQLRDKIKELNEGILQSVKQVLEDSEIPGDDKSRLIAFINLAFKKIYEDHIQMADWAQKSLGATIDHSRTSKTYDPEKAENCWLGWFYISSAKPPETILQPDVYPGNCWPFEGSEGQVVVKLPEKVNITAVTIQHISKVVSPSGEISSALKDFKVYGINEENENEILLGTFMYDSEKESIQTFSFENKDLEPFLYVKFHVKSNWGNPNFTCIYRVRVHGKMTKELNSMDQGKR